MKFTSSTSLVRMILKHAIDSKIDAKSLLNITGINPDVLGDANKRIPANRLYELWKEVETRAQDPYFGLHVGESMKTHPGGSLLFSVMMNSPTVGDALDKFCRYHRIMNDAVQPFLEVKKGMAFLSWEMRPPRLPMSYHISEALLCIFQSILIHLTGRRFKPVEIRFRHEQPKNISPHQRVFQAPIQFNQKRDELVIQETVLNKEVFLADPELLETLERYVLKMTDRIGTPDTWKERVIQSINKNLNGEKPPIKKIARDLAVSVRSLQNKLRDEGSSFQMLVDKVRKEKAMDYLKNREMTLVDIAFILGFSEQSAFNHAFKRWTGKTPKQYL